jgi:5'(3')-deoxyribonucleotidase
VLVWRPVVQREVMKIVGVDIDGVLSDFRDAAGKVCTRLFNNPSYYSRIITCTDFDSFGLTKEERSIFWKEIDTIPDWWVDHKPMLDTYMLENLTNSYKYRVVFITNRKDGAGWPIDKQSYYWLEHNYNIGHANVVLSDDKGPVAKGLKLDYYIDDRPKNVAEVVQTYPRCQTFLLDATYNQEFSYPHRVKSFNEFAKIVLEA